MSGGSATVGRQPKGGLTAEARATPAPTPKIAYLCSEYPAISHTFILREVEALRKLGAEITTFSIRRTPPDRLLADADRAAADTTVAILPPRRLRLLTTHFKVAVRSPRHYLSTLRLALRLAPRGLKGRLWQLFYFIESVVVWSECREREIRHIHVHLANAAADVGLLATHLGSATEPEQAWSWSFTMHGPTEFFDLRHFRLAEKLQSARFVVCISNFARSQLMALSEPGTWDRLHVVHVGIPVGQFTRSRPIAPDPDLEILYIGRLVPEKGQAVLLEAVALLKGRGRSVRVTLAGDGQLRGELEWLAGDLGIESQVSFLGAVGQEQLHDLYESAAIFCLPSFAEGVPVVLMEAMAMEVPAISTRIAGIPELIEDGHSGLLVAPGSLVELADSLEELLADPAFRRQLGSQGRAKVMGEFDAERSAKQLYELFSRHLS
jgi:colanic acid/amylovoran biosynthesis glycosyltransferase